MEMENDVVYKQLLAIFGVVLRAVSVSLGTWLASHGYVSLATWAEIGASIGVLLLLVAPIAYSAVKQWFLAKFKAVALTPNETNQFAIVANNLPVGTPLREIKQTFREETGVKKL